MKRENFRKVIFFFFKIFAVSIALVVRIQCCRSPCDSISHFIQLEVMIRSWRETIKGHWSALCFLFLWKLLSFVIKFHFYFFKNTEVLESSGINKNSLSSMLFKSKENENRLFYNVLPWWQCTMRLSRMRIYSMFKLASLPIGFLLPTLQLGCIQYRPRPRLQQLWFCICCDFILIFCTSLVDFIY